MSQHPDLDRLLNWAFAALVCWACALIAVGLWLDLIGKGW